MDGSLSSRTIMTPSNADTSSAFSLVEVVAVLFVIAILSVGSISLLGPTLRSQKLNSTASTVYAVLDQARQQAITSQRRVLVRFFRTEGAFSTLQTYLSEDETWRPVARSIRIPEGVDFHSSPVFSSLLAGSRSGDRQSPPPPSGLAGEIEDIREFEFRPNGSTDLDATNDWTLTLLNVPSESPDGELPSNFITLQLESKTGRLKQFQP